MAGVHVTDSTLPEISKYSKQLSYTVYISYLRGYKCQQICPRLLVALCPVSCTHFSRCIAISANYATSFPIYRRPCSRPQRLRANAHDAFIVREFDELASVTGAGNLPGLSLSLKCCGARNHPGLTFIINV